MPSRIQVDISSGSLRRSRNPLDVILCVVGWVVLVVGLVVTGFAFVRVGEVLEAAQALGVADMDQEAGRRAAVLLGGTALSFFSALPWWVAARFLYLAERRDDHSRLTLGLLGELVAQGAEARRKD